MNPTPRIALFDLDGTIARRDTFGPWVLGLLRRQPLRLLRLPRLLPPLVAFVLSRIDHGELKSALIRHLLGGLQRAQIEAWTQTYVQRVVPQGLFAAALAAIATHRAAGDRLVLLSASPDLFVPALAAAMGFDQVICTGVRWDGDILHGALTTANRRGAEKLRCLQELRAGHPGCTVTAYGNSPPDLLHLQACDVAVYVNPGRALRASLHDLGLCTVEWR